MRMNVESRVYMQVVLYEEKYAARIADLLNDYLPFEPETAETVEQASGIRFICLDGENVIGYVAGYIIEDIHADFPYFEAPLAELHALITKGSSIYTSHFVVHPGYRKQGIGTKLVRAFMEAAEQVAKTIIVVGWVQSDTNLWEAERLFTKRGCQQIAYIPRYFEPYNVYCPSCQGTCHCDANILVKNV